MHQLRTRSIHIVKRYGNVGGMERYVWELTHHLASLGHQVVVVCEQQYDALEAGNPLYGIQVIQLGSAAGWLPRWINMLLFSRKVRRKMCRMDTRRWVVHSHERTGVHDLTTFHGPSIEARKHSALDRLSPRLYAWAWMERREIFGLRVQSVVPVSDVSRRQLVQYYPRASKTIGHPVFPGVRSSFNALRKASRSKTIGFIGVEWRRKGLDILINSVKRLRKEDAKIQLLVAGCEPGEVRHLFRDWDDGFELLGWIDPVKLYSRIDLLVLPARKEPLGMVVAEANAAGLPVVVSNRCGIAPFITRENGRVISLDRPLQLDQACRTLLARVHPVSSLNLQWIDTANQYAKLYREIVWKKVTAAAPIEAGNRIKPLHDYIVPGNPVD